MNIEDPDELLSYLEAGNHLGREEVEGVEVLRGGVSNRTVLVRRRHGKDWVVKQALAKLRVQDDWYSDPERIHREAEGMRVLERIAPEGSIVSLIFEDRRRHILAMEAVEQPHRNWKTDLLDGVVSEDLIVQFGSFLSHIHSSFEVGSYPRDGRLRDTTFFESLRLEPYYLRSAERAPQSRAFLEALVRQTRENAVSLVHGDYSPKNVLVFDGKMILLDHEVIHIGDPAFDVGFSITHLLSKAHHVAGCRARFERAARTYWETYQGGLRYVAWNERLERDAVNHTLGCLLARVAGRSPLEYLSDRERTRQRHIAVDLMHDVPASMPELITAFVGSL